MQNFLTGTLTYNGSKKIEASSSVVNSRLWFGMGSPSVS